MKKSESGQMLLIVVLIMIVALTVGLSIVSRTITNLKISKENDQSQQAFQAAEAGIEQALQSNSSSAVNPSFSNNASYESTVDNPVNKEFLLNDGDDVSQDSGIDVWLSDYPTYANPRSGLVTIHWSTTDQKHCGLGNSDNISALEVDVLSNLASPTLTKYIFDGSPCLRIPGKTVNPAIVSPGGTIDGTAFNYYVTISISNGLIMKVIPVFNSTKIAVDTDSTQNLFLPTQGSVVESTGKSGDTVRKVRYFSSYPQIPVEIFPYSLISQ